MGIKHIKEASDVNKVNDEDWNEDHVVTNLLGYELVEEKTLPAGTTSCTFSDLDGDVDEEYLIEHEIEIVASSGDRVINIYPNGASTNLKAFLHYYTDSAHGYNNETIMRLCSNTWSKDGFSWGQFKFKVITGRKRFFENIYSFISTDLTRTNHNDSYGYWNETVTNIISIVITISAGSFSGTIRLWKKISIE